ncbi:MAG TPA: S1C family serine protease [Opitutales bacterium]|nr:S1C family serine protease [Opitutales bacterium]
MRLRFAWIIALVCFAGPFAQAELPNALALQQRLIEVFEQNKGAIVRVKAAYPQPEVVDGKAKIMLRVGTGFFISREGHVLVSASRAAGASRVWVEYEGKSYATESIGHDRLTNVSVVRVLSPPEDFSIINLDTTVGHPKLGAIAVAITCPLDFSPTPAMGLFTGVDKKLANQIFPTEYIRTTIPVDAGQGGCPILDINGRFIGMSVASIPDLGGSYCLPVDALVRVRDDLIFAGKIIHSWLGFEVTAQLNDLDSNDVVLSKVHADAPAAQAGLKEGDRLLSIGGREIDEVTDVRGAIFFTRANQFTSIKFERDGEVREVSVKTLPRPEEVPEIKPNGGEEGEGTKDEVGAPEEATPENSGGPAE